jgi:hypothetical protein
MIFKNKLTVSDTESGHGRIIQDTAENSESLRCQVHNTVDKNKRKNYIYAGQFYHTLRHFKGTVQQNF